MARLIPCTLIGFEEGPVCQTVVDGNDDRVFEKLGENHQEEHEEATGGQVAPAHLRTMEKCLRTAETLQRADDDRESVFLLCVKGSSAALRVDYLPRDLRSSDCGRRHVVILFLLLFSLC